jgi:WD40 repeat protein
VLALAFSPDGASLAVGGSSGVRLWEAVAGHERWAVNRPGAAGLVRFTADGRRLVVVRTWRFSPGGQEFQVLDAGTGAEVGHRDASSEHLAGLALGPDATTLAAVGMVPGQQVVSLRPPDGGVIGRLPMPHFLPQAGAFRGDGARLALAGQDTGLPRTGLENAVRVWDLTPGPSGQGGDAAGPITGKETLCLRGHSRVSRCVAWSPDGTRLATGSDDRTVSVWDAETGQELLILKGPTAAVGQVAWSPDGRLLASADDSGTILLWDGSPLP